MGGAVAGIAGFYVGDVGRAHVDASSCCKVVELPRVAGGIEGHTLDDQLVPFGARGADWGLTEAGGGVEGGKRRGA